MFRLSYITNLMNRIERNLLAENLRHYIAGRISNFAFEEKTEHLFVAEDLGLREIQRTFWLCYSDLKEHMNAGRHSLGHECERQLLRCIIFLKSNRPFEWQPWKYENIPFLRFFIHHFTFGLYPKKWDQRQVDQLGGDLEAWPFLNEADFLEEIANPKYLNSNA